MSYIGDKRFLGIFTFYLVTFLIHKEFSLFALSTRTIFSFLLFDDYKLSWSKASTKTGLMKIILALISFMIYMPVLYYLYNVHFIYRFDFLYIYYKYFSLCI